MTNEEWTTCDSATEMLVALYVEQPKYFQKSVRDLHEFLIACCWKHQHFIPQEGLREGLRGAKDWIAGKINNEELNRLNWFAEADAFFLDYCDEPDDVEKIKVMIGGISELEAMTFDEARGLLKRAAYFAESSMIYPILRMGTAQKRPERTKVRPERWHNGLFQSEFLCPDLLRAHLVPDLAD